MWSLVVFGRIEREEREEYGRVEHDARPGGRGTRGVGNFVQVRVEEGECECGGVDGSVRLLLVGHCFRVCPTSLGVFGSLY